MEGSDERPEVRIADADRQQVIDRLRVAVGEGRLDLDEFSDRAGDVYAARTRRDLEVVISDLPAVLEAPRPDVARVDLPVPTTRGQHSDRPAARTIVAVMNGARRRGRWRIGEHTRVTALWGSVDLDLRGAILDAPTIEIHAWAIMGSIDVVVPEGLPVEVTGMVIMGSSDNQVRDLPVLPGAPLVVVHSHGLWGSVRVRSKPIEGDKRELRRARREARRASLPLPQIPPLPLPLPPLPRMPRPDRDVERLVNTLRHDPPDLRAAAAPDGTVTILFSDIEGSTEHADRLGDRRWLDVLRAHNELVRAEVAACGGREVKVQGDGFMVAFSSASRALRCAIAIQRSLDGWRRTSADVALHVRIGVHTGEVLSDGDDFFGKHVMVAARIVGEARGDEILTSSIVRELTDGGDVSFDDGREVELRGLPRAWRLYTVDW